MKQTFLRFERASVRYFCENELDSPEKQPLCRHINRVNKKWFSFSEIDRNIEFPNYDN
jgi:hypothetical protein